MSAFQIPRKDILPSPLLQFHVLCLELAFLVSLPSGSLLDLTFKTVQSSEPF